MKRKKYKISCRKDHPPQKKIVIGDLSVTVIVVGNKIGDQCSNPGRILCFSRGTNTFMKGKKSSVLPHPSDGKIAG